MTDQATPTPLPHHLVLAPQFQSAAARQCDRTDTHAAGYWLGMNRAWYRCKGVLNGPRAPYTPPMFCGEAINHLGHTWQGHTGTYWCHGYTTPPPPPVKPVTATLDLTYSELATMRTGLVLWRDRAYRGGLDAEHTMAVDMISLVNQAIDDLA